MADVPYPLTGADTDELRTQIGNLIRDLYEEKIGGASLGDVFSIVGDVLTLALADNSGLTKAGNLLAVLISAESGLAISATDGLQVYPASDGGLENSASGLGIKLEDSSLEISSSGLKVAGSGTYTDEKAQDAVGSILVDSDSIDFTYTDATPDITATVKEAGVDHDSLQNYSANKHIDHTNVTLTAGTGLTGGGDISGNRTFAVDGVLEDLDALGAPDSDGQIIVATGAGAFAYESGATARASLGTGVDFETYIFTDGGRLVMTPSYTRVQRA